MGFTFLSNSLSTDHKVQTELKDYGDRITYPVSLSLQVSTGDGWMIQTISFHTREAARETIIELVGKCNGWLADELGLYREPPPPEVVWPEAEQEALAEKALREKTLSTPRLTVHKPPRGVWGSGVGE